MKALKVQTTYESLASVLCYNINGCLHFGFFLPGNEKCLVN